MLGVWWVLTACVISEGTKADGLDPDGDGVDWPEDCASADPDTFPGAAELESGTLCMTDADGDGYGARTPRENAEAGTDCDDANPARHPGAEEQPYDGVDNDCSSWTPDDDLDGDGYDHEEDCDDQDASANPSETEQPYTGVDEDCDESTPDDDLDGDGFGLTEDCDDEDAALNPNADDASIDGVDQDCDGVDGPDRDGDGHVDADEGGDDCDDADGSRYPGAPEVCEDFVVNDCDSDGDQAWDDCFGAEINLGDAEGFGHIQGHWTTSGDQGHRRVRAASGPGDVIGDAGDDVLIGGFIDSDDAVDGEVELAWVFGGASAGSMTTQDADLTITADLGAGYFGATAVSSAGDLNADGHADLLLGAWLSDADRRGTSWLFYGPLSTGTLDVSQADLSWEGDDGVRAGGRLEFVGQVDGEGGDEVLISGEYYVDDQNSSSYRAGSAYLIYGDAPQSGALSSVADVMLLGTEWGGFAGSDVSGAGDFDGSGRDDILIGADGYADDDGRAFVMIDDTLNLVRGASLNVNEGVAYYTVEATASNARLGSAVASAGDLDGDGYGDILVGAQRHGTTGAAHVVLGALRTQDVVDLRIDGEHTWGRFGSAVSTAGDINDDGFDDFLIGDNLNLTEGEEGTDGVGYAYLFPGGPVYATQPTLSTSDAISRFEGAQDASMLGNVVAGLGDTDADGFDDFAIGARSHLDGDGVDVGAIYLFRGTWW